MKHDEREYRVLRHLVDASPDAMMTTTAEGVIIEANPAAHKLFHRSPSELHETPVFQYLMDEYGIPLESVIGRTIRGFGGVRNRHVFVKWGDGPKDRTPCCLTVYPLVVEEGDERKIDRVVGIFRDQTEIERLVTTDRLTGLHNEHGFMDRLEEYLRLSRRKGWPLAIAYLDVSKFKPINDRYRHAEGDRALMKLGARLKQFTFDTDIRARLHGDEFAVLLIRPDRDKLDKIAKNLVEASRFSIDLRLGDELESVEIASSIGICWREGPGIPEDPQLFLDLADEAMYVCKKADGSMLYHIDANGIHKP
ncbi:MAG TPA: sensor domain-containing diguanylate cyclase [Verrucomicrobiae bacterium]|nr:sensor domain-containing diguanylate cyclase [Verrucomicrobiae bacterium]